MRVLIICPDSPVSSMGGVGVQVGNMLRAFPPEVTCTMVCLQGGKGYTTAPGRIGPHTIHYTESVSLVNPIKDFFGEVSLVSAALVAKASVVAATEGPFDIVHAYDWLSVSAACYVKVLLNIPLVWTPSLALKGLLARLKISSPQYDLFLNLEDTAYKVADAVQHVSSFSARDRPSGRDWVVPNGWGHAEEFEGVELAPRDNVPIKKILFLARNAFQKGTDLVCELVESGRWPKDLELILTAQEVGSDPGLTARVLALKDHPQITVVHNVKGRAKWELIASADAVLMPSIFEPFGLVALECQMSYRPLICSAIDGLGDFLREGEFIHCPLPEEREGRLAGILRGVAEALTMPNDQRSHLVRQARKNAEGYTWESNTKALTAMYTHLTKK